MAENKLMMACHAQVYFVHEIAVELQPTVQTILVYETLPEEFPFIETCALTLLSKEFFF